MKLTTLFSGLSAVLLFSQISYAATYDEAVNGNFSNNQNAPTPFVVDPGANTVKGSCAMNTWDFFKITVPSGYVLSSVILTNYNSGGNQSFAAVAQGPIIPLAPPNPMTAAGLLGYKVFSAADIGTNLLNTFAIPNQGGQGNSGFTPPLAANTYSFWVQDTAQNITYQFTLNIVPAGPPPVTKITGSKNITTTLSTVKLKGKTLGTFVSKVEYRIGSKPYKLAKGTTAWKITAKNLKIGRNVIKIRAHGPAGIGNTVKVIVTRKAA